MKNPKKEIINSETRTFLSKLIWLGNGGKRPQYGNPETKVPWLVSSTLATLSQKNTFLSYNLFFLPQTSLVGGRSTFYRGRR